MKVNLILLILLISLNFFTNALLNKEKDCKCRISSQKRIAGGKISDKNKYPFLASLTYNSFKFFNRRFKKALPIKIKTNGLTCSATIINKSWLITAASCLSGDIDNLSFGFGNGNDLVKQFEQDHIPISNIIVHPQFNNKSGNKNFAYNLALIKLKNELDFDLNLIGPACFQLKKENYTNLFAAGYGSTINILSNIEDNSKSRYLKELNLVDKSNENKKCLENSRLMCTKTNNNDRLTLNDLGGPIVSIIKGKSYVVSILSHLEIAIDNENKRAHFTDQNFSVRISDSIKWIQKYVNDDYCSAD